LRFAEFSAGCEARIAKALAGVAGSHALSKLTDLIR
jgi:hypothetical protein